MPKVVDHEKYKTALLAKSFQFFADKGYDKVTMRQLAQHIGVSTGTLYHYFPKKEAIFDELIDFLAQQDFSMAAVRLKKTGTLEDRLEQMLDVMVEQHTYFLKQTALWMDFGRQNGFATLTKNRAIINSCQQSAQWLSDYLEVYDKTLLAFLSSVLHGMMLEVSFGYFSVSPKKQSKLIAAAIRFHQESKS